MALRRDVASWDWSHWAGTTSQLASAITVSKRKVDEAWLAQNRGTKEDDSLSEFERGRAAFESKRAQELEIQIAEEHGYYRTLTSVEEFLATPASMVKSVRCIRITVGNYPAAPGIEIQGDTDNLLRHGFSVKIVGYDRIWTAGLRHELEQMLKPQWRLHAPFISEPVLPLLSMVVLSTIFAFVGLPPFLKSVTHLSDAARLMWSMVVFFVLIGAVVASIWASFRRFELLLPGEQPRYPRWRSWILGGTGAIIIGLLSSAIWAAFTSH